MRTKSAVSISFAVTLALVACGGETQAPAPAEQAPAAAPAPVKPSPPPVRQPPSAPTETPPQARQGEESKGPVTLAAHGANAAKGEALYQQYCASCHGPKGCGGGPLSAALSPTPALHCDGVYMNPLSNEHLFRVVKMGGAAVGKSPLMAPWGGTLSDQQIWDTVAFVRGLADPPYSGQ